MALDLSLMPAYNVKYSLPDFGTLIRFHIDQNIKVDGFSIIQEICQSIWT